MNGGEDGRNPKQGGPPVLQRDGFKLHGGREDTSRAGLCDGGEERRGEVAVFVIQAAKKRK